MAVASGGTQKIISLVLDHLKIRHLFDAVVTSEMVKHQKPAPDIFLEAATAHRRGTRNLAAATKTPTLAFKPSAPRAWKRWTYGDCTVKFCRRRGNEAHSEFGDSLRRLLQIDQAFLSWASAGNRPLPALTLSQFLRFFRRGADGAHHDGAHPPLLQFVQSFNGRAAGAGDLVLERAGMLAGFQNHFGRT